jgi:hypothetical protein
LREAQQWRRLKIGQEQRDSLLGEGREGREGREGMANGGAAMTVRRGNARP